MSIAEKIIQYRQTKAPIDHNDLSVLYSTVEYNEKRDELDYILFDMVTSGKNEQPKHFYKAIKLYRLMLVPKNEKIANFLMEKQSEVLASMWEHRINFLSLVANILDPAIGLVYTYGVQGVAETIEDAKQQADHAFASLGASLKGTFRTIRYRRYNYEESEWLRKKMIEMKYLSVLKGIPYPHQATNPQSMAKSSVAGGSAKNDVRSQTETMEELISGLTDHEYIMLTMATPIHEKVLKNWLQTISKEETKWASILQGTSTISFNMMVPLSFGGNSGGSMGVNHGASHTIGTGHTHGTNWTDGISHTVSNGTSHGISHGNSSGTSGGTGTSHGVSQGAGTSHTISNGEGTSHTESNGTGTSHTESNGTSTSHTVSTGTGTSNTVSNGTSTNHAVSTGTGTNNSESNGTGTSQSTSVGTGTSHQTSSTHGTSHSNTDSTGHSSTHTSSSGTTSSSSSGTTHSTSSGWTKGKTSGSSHTVSNGNTTGNTKGSTSGASTSKSSGSGTTYSKNYSNSNGVSANASLEIKPFGVGGSAGAGYNYNHSQGATSGSSMNHSTTDSSSHSNSQSTSASKSHSTSNGLSQSTSHSTSQSASNGTSQSTSKGVTNSTSNGTGITTTKGYSDGTTQTYGASNGTSTSNSSTNGTSTSNSISNGTSTSNSTSDGTGTSQTTSNGTSTSNSVSNGTGTSQTISNGTSTSHSVSDGNSTSHTVADGTSISDSTSNGTSTNKGWNKGLSNGTNDGTSSSVSNGTSSSQGGSQSVSNTVSDGITSGTSNGWSMASSASMGLAPGVSIGKSYQWKDTEVENVLKIIDYQKERLMKSLNGQGAFYVDTMIATSDEEALHSAMGLAKGAFYNKESLANPLQIMELKEDRKQHMLYHFNCFSPCLERDGVTGEMDSYTYSSVLLPDELTAYTHPPRLSYGGLYADVDDMPQFSVPSHRRNGHIYVGKVLSGQVWSEEQFRKNNNGHLTDFPFKIFNNELMHALFQGGSRSGKTEVAIRVVTEVSEMVRPTGKKLRIIVFDQKTDWRKLYYTVDKDRFRFFQMDDFNGNLGLKIHLFKIAPNVHPEIHIKTLVETFVSSYGLGILGSQITKDALFRLYEDRNCLGVDWKEKAHINSQDITFEDLYDYVEEDKKSAIANGMRNMSESYERVLMRVKDFARKGGVLNAIFSQRDGLGIHELLGNDDITVIEAKTMDRVEKSFVYGLLFALIYAYGVNNGTFLAEDQYETIIVVEEANAVLRGSDNSEGNGDNLPGQSRFEDIVDQSAGNGLFLFAITQSCELMPSSILSSCGLWFVGRTQSTKAHEVVLPAIGKNIKYDYKIAGFLAKAPTGWFIVKTGRVFDFVDSEPTYVSAEPVMAKKIGESELRMLSEHKKIREMKEKLNGN